MKNEPVEELELELEREKIPVDASNKPKPKGNGKLTNESEAPEAPEQKEKTAESAHGGKRKNAGRKKASNETKKPETTTIRLDKRLAEIVEMLKKELAEGNEQKIKEIRQILDKATP